jgi:hypothetical protein
VLLASHRTLEEAGDDRAADAASRLARLYERRGDAEGVRRWSAGGG